MSRSGYSDSIDNWDLIRWRGQVASALRGRRGQAFLREVLAALDAMPVKELAADVARDENGCFCTLGVVAQARGYDIQHLDALMNDWEHEGLGRLFDIAAPLVQEIMHINDDCWISLNQSAQEKRQARWRTVRVWVAKQIKEES